MTFAFAPPATAKVAIHNSSVSFPVHRIYCVGRNYAAHAREMGSDPDREPPFFFCKPADAVWPINPSSDISAVVPLPYASATTDLHHEIELVVAIGTGGREIPQGSALGHVWGYGVGLDMTRRDLQAGLKKKGQPWEIGKAFDRSAPVSPLMPVSQCGHPGNGRIWLNVNDQLKQDGDIADMIWSIPEIIQYLSTYFDLQPGDLIFTGTPEGVGPVKPGDRLNGGIAGLCEISLTIGENCA